MADPFGFDIEIDEATYQNVRKQLAGVANGANKAIVGAINKSIAQGKTIVVNRMAELLTAKRGKILKHVRTKNATNASKVGSIIIDKRPMSLASFKVKDTTNRKTHTGSGVIAQVYKSGETRIFPHAFIATGLGAKGEGNKLVFERIIGPSHRVTNPHFAGNLGRLKQSLHTVTGVSLRGVVKEHPAILADAKKKVQAILHDQILSQIDRLLGRRKVDRPLALAA